MAVLVGLTGFGGAGKTTAATYLESRGFGQRAYLGGVVLNEVIARGLPPTAENERLVRIDLRSRYGKGVMAVKGAERVTKLLSGGFNVFVDAIFELAEYEHLESACKPSACALLSLEASFETRALRLGARGQRSITPDDLKTRDETEIQTLGTLDVARQASHRIVNEGDMRQFQTELDAFWQNVTQTGTS